MTADGTCASSLPPARAAAVIGNGRFMANNHRQWRCDSEITASSACATDHVQGNGRHGSRGYCVCIESCDMIWKLWRTMQDPAACAFLARLLVMMRNCVRDRVSHILREAIQARHLAHGGAEGCCLPGEAG